MRPDEMRRMRRDVDMTQQAMADAIGMSRETIGAMERGQAPIETRTALAVIAITARRWQPIATAPLGNSEDGPFFDVCWQGETHRYLPVLRRETDCFNDGRGIKREHSYPSVTTVFLRKPTHWMSPPLDPARDDASTVTKENDHD